jgi:hypothetical protein
MRRSFRLLRISCHALHILLVLAMSAAPSLAQSLVCHPIRRGESAGQAARRVTGDSRNTYLASFQIMNGSSRFIPKSQYNRLLVGWRACVVREPTRSTASYSRRLDPPPAVAGSESVSGASDIQRANEPDAPQAAGVPVALTPPIAASPIALPVRLRVSAYSAASVSPRRIGNVDLMMVWLSTAIAAPWFGLQILDGYLTRRKTASVLVQLFANRFITEFERPLVRYDSTERPLKARVRRARRGGFDILLAPGPGRRYPNLTDHKRNVEYDVDRVLDALDDHAFVNGALYTQSGWVVVPFQPRTGSKQPQPGVICLSSF